MNIGVTLASFQQSGRDPCCNIKRNNKDRGKAREGAKDFKKIAGIPSGPGVDLGLSLISLDFTETGSNKIELKTIF